MKLFVLVPLLALAACNADSARLRTEAEIEDIASDAAADVMSAKDAELEARLTALERRLDVVAINAANLRADTKSKDDWAEDNINRLFCNDGFAQSCRAMDSIAAN